MSADSRAAGSGGYYLSVATGCVALSMTVFALAGMWAARHGHDPVDALSGVGLVGFIFSYAPAFAARVIFQPGASSALKAGARGFIGSVFALSMVATLAAAAFLLTGQAGSPAGLTTLFTLLAAVCQAGAVTWFIRYAGR